MDILIAMLIMMNIITIIFIMIMTTITNMRALVVASMNTNGSHYGHIVSEFIIHYHACTTHTMYCVVLVPQLFRFYL